MSLGREIPKPGIEQLEDDPCAYHAEGEEIERELAWEHQREQLRAERIANDGDESTNTLKQEYARRLFYLIMGWLIAVLLIVAATGAGWLKLTDKILLALIGSTTANLVGLLYIVVSHLFPKAGTK